MPDRLARHAFCVWKTPFDEDNCAYGDNTRPAFKVSFAVPDRNNDQPLKKMKKNVLRGLAVKQSVASVG